MSDDDNAGSIPKRHQEFCKAMGRLCREHGLLKFSGSYTPPLGDNWQGDIQMVWEDGRHGEDSDKLFIQSNIRVWTRLGQKVFVPK